MAGWASDSTRWYGQVLWEGNRAPYDVFWDMYDAVLYLGYVSVLSLQQPLFPLIVFFNNMIEEQ